MQVDKMGWIIAYMDRFLGLFGRDLTLFLEPSLQAAAAEQVLDQLAERLRTIVPDLSDHSTTHRIEGSFLDKKLRNQHAFQVRFLEKVVRKQNKKRLTVVDIGDSSGLHLNYLKAICPDISFDTISVNLDEEAVNRISAKGMKALHCRAEELDLGDQTIDLFVTFQMVEHLMNPCLFFRRLAVRGNCDKLLVTVPYRRISRVALRGFRRLIPDLEENAAGLSRHLDFLPTKRQAEDEHIFELSPLDWKLLMIFSGWRPVYDEIYLQYPRRHPLRLTKPVWREVDSEGFWGVFLERDLSFSNIYQDWEDDD